MANALEQIGQLIRAGRFNDAEQVCGQVLAQAPDQPHTLYFLGMIALNRGELDEAIGRFDRAIAQQPEVVEFHLNRGVACLRALRLDEAQASLMHCLELKADDAWAMANLALLANERGDGQVSVDWLRKACDAQPGMWEFKYNLANALRRVHQLEEASQLYQDVLEAQPTFQSARMNLGGCLRAQGRVAEASAVFRRITRSAPKTVAAWQNLLLTRQFDPGGNASENLELAQQLAEVLTADIEPLPAVEVDRSARRRLRIGFVGASYYQHPHGHLLWPLIEHLDREEYEVHIFSQRHARQTQGDPVAQSLRSLADRWHDTAELSPAAMAQFVREQAIDVLVETNRHLEGSSLPMLAYKPAPVQVSWLGGPQITTGLDAVDYLLTDARHVPAGRAKYYTEQVVRLEGDYICWHPPTDAPQVAHQPPSVARDQPVTFGYLGQLPKLSRPVVQAWARVLADCPDAQLLMKQGPLSDEATADRWRDTFKRAGVDPDRLIFEGAAPHDEFLEAYGRVDIGLDSFPYSGGVSTLEALWMGVPVVSMVWPSNRVANHGASHLPAAGCRELLAADADEFVAKAVALAGDADRLVAYRRGLRDQVAASAICDGAAYAARFGEAVQAMWRGEA